MLKLFVYSFWLVFRSRIQLRQRFFPSADICCLEGGWHRDVFALDCTETSAAPRLGVTQTAGVALLILLGHTARHRQHMMMKVTSTHYEPGSKIINTHTAQTAREQES